MLIRSLGQGGAERQFVLLAVRLARRGLAVRVVTFYDGGELAPELDAAGVERVSLAKRGRWDSMSFLARLLRALRSHGAPVVYSFMPSANIAAALASFLLGGTRLVWGIRAANMPLASYGRFVSLVGRVEVLLSRVPSTIICNSEAGREHCAGLGFPPGRLVVIVNGIDVDRFRNDAGGRDALRAEWGIGPAQVAIGIVARLDQVKGHATFLQAAAEITCEHADAVFVCVGEGGGEFASGLRRLAAELGIERRVIWAGARSDMARVYSALDVATSASYSEGFSNAIAEAMACELPCVVTDTGDSRVVVGDTGLVVPPADHRALACAWRRMLAMTGAGRRALGQRARERVVARFSVDVMVDATERTLLGAGS